MDDLTEFSGLLKLALSKLQLCEMVLKYAIILRKNIFIYIYIYIQSHAHANTDKHTYILHIYVYR